MPQVLSFLKHQVPRDIATQIRSGIRFVWPQLNPGLTTIWTPPPGVPLDRMTFVLVDGEILISHTEVNFRKLEHAGEIWEVGGLSAVFTYPAHRGSGAGERVVAAATDHLRQSNADFALLFCGQRVKSLYTRLGWETVPGLKVTFGEPPGNQTYGDGYALTLYVSDRARAHRFVETEPLYVGHNTW